MRDNEIRALLEGIARRGPWGTVFRMPDADGKQQPVRLSLTWLRNQITGDGPEPTPRADKGPAYVTDPALGMNRYGKPKGTTRRIFRVRAA